MVAVADGQSDGLTIGIGAAGVLGHFENDWWSGWGGKSELGLKTRRKEVDNVRT